MKNMFENIKMGIPEMNTLMNDESLEQPLNSERKSLYKGNNNESYSLNMGRSDSSYSNDKKSIKDNLQSITKVINLDDIEHKSKGL
jgi:hypothetical protein